MSQSARSALLVVPLSRARIASFCCAVIPPFSTGTLGNFVNDFSIRKALIEKLLLDFEHGDIESGRGADLRNAGTH